MNDLRNKAILNVITGPRDSGKSTLCLKVINSISTENIQVTGIVSQGVYIEDKKKFILAIDISTGDKNILAEYSPGWDEEFPQREWKFDPDVIEWGNDVIRRSLPTDVLFIDELGYLEFEKKCGWLNAFEVLDSGTYHTAFVVIRPKFVSIFSSQYPQSFVYSIDNINQLESLNKKIITQLSNTLIN